MPPKRTRSAAAQEADVNSSNVTDYIGPPAYKRPKSANQPTNASARVTRSRPAARVSAEASPTKAASARQRAGLQRVEEDDDDEDDGSVNVPFNQVSSAVNEARLGRPRTINGLQLGKSGAVSGGAKGDEEEEEEEEREDGTADAGEEGVTENTPPPRRKRGRPPKAKPIEQPSQQSRLKTGQRTGKVKPTDDVYGYDSAQVGENLSRQGEGIAQEKSTRKPATRRTQQQRQRTPEKPSAPPEDDEEAEDPASDESDLEAVEDGAAEGSDSDESDLEAVEDMERWEESQIESDEQDADKTTAGAAEDSAFIDAPRPDEQLMEVTCTLRSLGGIFKTLRHSAWTGVSKWDADPQMKCETKTGGQLMAQAARLNDLLVDAAEVRDHEDADGTHEITFDFLRQNNTKVQSLFASITELVDTICAQKLVAAANLEARPVKTRKRFLRDISKRLIPMLILVVQEAFEVGPHEKKKTTIHLTLNTYTIQFLLRAAGWAVRLTEALIRGVREWPIDDESDLSEDDLGRVEGTSKDDKEKARELFQKQLSSLHSAVTKAARDLDRQARDGKRKAREDQARRKAMIDRRNVWAAEEREREEERRRSAQQYANFARASQVLKGFQDPLAEKMRRAVEARDARAAPWNPHQQRLASHAHAIMSQRSKGKERAVEQLQSDDDPFAINEDEYEMFPSPVRNDHLSSNRHTQNGISRAGSFGPSSQWNRAWSEQEEKALIKGLREEDYNLFAMAKQLGRSAEDVGTKAAGYRAIFRDIYRARNVEIPAWAW